MLVNIATVNTALSINIIGILSLTPYYNCEETSGLHIFSIFSTALEGALKQSEIYGGTIAIMNNA